MLDKILPLENIHPSLIKDGVPAGEQVMAADKAFWAFFTPNLCISTWLFGILAAQGLGFWPAMLAITIGIALGAAPTAALACMGPNLRLSQLEGSRYSFGRHGVKVPAILNWFTLLGWDAINNVPAAGAWAALGGLMGLPTPYWLALALLAGLQMFIAIYGHHVVQIITKYMGWLLLVIFLGLGIKAMMALHGTLPGGSVFSVKAFVLSISLVASGSISWAPCAADYTRYLPAQTPRAKIFWRVFGGIMAGILLLMFFGVITANLVTDMTAQGLTATLQNLAGPFAPMVLLVVGLSSIPPNAINDNSASYCLVTAGVRILRPVSALLGATVGFALALYGSTGIMSLATNVILLLFYWVAAWVGIVLVQSLSRRQKRLAVLPNWLPGATIFCIVTPLTILIFAANDLYIGPVAQALGGIDVGYYIAFGASALLYWLSLGKDHAAR